MEAGVRVLLGIVTSPRRIPDAGQTPGRGFRFEGIKLRGTFEFPVADYAHRLMPSLVIGMSMAGREASG